MNGNGKSNHSLIRRLKKFVMVWVWRTQQVGSISTLLITAVTLTLTLSDKIVWRIGNTYAAILLTFGCLASLILGAGWGWDKKLQMWKEQNEVNVERNPYYLFKQTPKEVASYELLWFPIADTLGDICDALGLTERAKEMRLFKKRYGGWCREQVESDPILKRQVNELSDYLKSKGD